MSASPPIIDLTTEEKACKHNKDLYCFHCQKEVCGKCAYMPEQAKGQDLWVCATCRCSGYSRFWGRMECGCYGVYEGPEDDEFATENVCYECKDCSKMFCSNCDSAPFDSMDSEDTCCKECELKRLKALEPKPTKKKKKKYKSMVDQMLENHDVYVIDCSSGKGAKTFKGGTPQARQLSKHIHAKPKSTLKRKKEQDHECGCPERHPQVVCTDCGDTVCHNCAVDLSPTVWYCFGCQTSHHEEIVAMIERGEPEEPVSDSSSDEDNLMSPPPQKKARYEGQMTQPKKPNNKRKHFV